MCPSDLHLACKWGDMALFYNGAKCGASAPDHAHLQAVRRNDVPLLDGGWDDDLELEPVVVAGDGEIYNAAGYVLPFFVITSSKVSTSLRLFELLQSAMPLCGEEEEPRMNVMTYFTPDEGYVTLVFPRSEHRPACYYADGAGQRVVSPGTLDMAGLVITPREDDFRSMTAAEVAGILREVALSHDGVCDIVERLKVAGDED